MENPASISDVTDSYERPLNPDESRVVPAWLGKAWRELQRVVPGIPARVALDVDAVGYLSNDDVIDVIVAMVERKLRNPDGLRTWNGDDYGQTIDNTLSSGQIYVTDAEIASLGIQAEVGGTAIYSIPLSR